MKNQVLFSLKDKSKKINMSSAEFIATLRVNQSVCNQLGTALH